MPVLPRRLRVGSAASLAVGRMTRCYNMRKGSLRSDLHGQPAAYDAATLRVELRSAIVLLPGGSPSANHPPGFGGWPEGNAPSSPGSHPGTLLFMLQPQFVPLTRENGAAPRDRTGRRRFCRPRRSLARSRSVSTKQIQMVSTAGIAPAASAFAGRRSDLLSYADMKRKLAPRHGLAP